MPWDRPITTLGADIRNEYRTDIRDVAFTAFTLLQQASPVGNPSLWRNPNSAPDGYVGGTFRRSWEIAQEGDEWVVFNNQPYAQRLEEGHSQRQAPNGFLDQTIASLQVLR